MNRSTSWIALLVVAAVLALLLYGFRSTPAGWVGLGLKVVLGRLIALVFTAVCWNTIAVLTRSK